MKLLGTVRTDSNWLACDRYNDLTMKQSEVERLFKSQA
jgi:hypothetical protein